MKISGKKVQSSLNIVYVEAFNIPDAWGQCLYEVLQHGRKYCITRGSYEGQHRLELDFAIIHIAKPGHRPIVPSFNCPGVPPPTNMEYIYNYLPYLMSDTKTEEEDYTYGERLTNPKFAKILSLDDLLLELEENETKIVLSKNIAGHALLKLGDMALAIEKVQNGLKISVPLGLNQIDLAIQIYRQMFKEKGDYWTNQITLEIGMPSDLSLENPPCLRLIDTKIIEGKLHFYPYFRSWDLWAGFPSNLAAIQLMKEYMAEELKVKDGEIIATSKGLHLYDHVWSFAETLTRFDADKQKK